MNFFTIKNDYFFGLAILSLLVVVFFLPVVIGRQTLFEALPTVYNNKLYNFPYLKTTWTIDGGTLLRAEAPETIDGVRQIRRGDLPLWTPYVGAGQPLAGYPVSGLYHPLRVIIFSAFPYLAAFDIFAISRIFIAGFGLFLFLKEIGLKRKSALLGAIAFMFSGYFMTYLTLWFIAVDMAVPYVLWAFEKYFKKPDLKSIALTGLILAFMIFGSQPESSVPYFLILAIYFLIRLFRIQVVKISRGILHFILIMIIAALVSLPLIVDFSVFLINLGFDHALGPNHVSWPEMLHLIVSPSMFLEISMAGQIYKGTFTVVPYLGISVIVLMFVGLFHSGRFKFLKWFFAGLIAFFVMKIAGFPLVNWVGTLPILDQIIWTRLFMPIVLGVSILAAVGFQDLDDRNVAFKKIFIALMIVPSLNFFYWLASMQGFYRWFVPHLDFFRRPDLVPAVEKFLDSLPAGFGYVAALFLDNGIYFTAFIIILSVLTAILALVLIHRYLRSGKGVFLNLLVCLVVLELFIYLPKIRDGSFRRFNPYPEAPVITQLQELTRQADGTRFIGSRDVLTPNQAEIFGLYDYRISTITLDRYRIFSESAGLKKRTIGNFGFEEKDFDEKMKRFFGIASIGYIASEESLANDSLLNKLPSQDLLLYQNQSALPRAYVVYQHERRLSPEEAAQRLAEVDFDYYNSVVIDGGRYPSVISGPYISKAASISEYSPMKVVIKADIDKPGLLVLTDAFYPGWKAFIDGKQAKIYPANVLFRAVAVPAGTHTIIFKYKPWWVYASLVLSLTTLVFVATVLIRKEPTLNQLQKI